MMSDSPLPTSADRGRLGHDWYQKENDRLHAYWAETRQRVDTLLKAILVLSGSALTISIGIFLRPNHPMLDRCHVTMLHWSWGLLFASVISCFLLMSIMICQSYFRSEIWLRNIQNKSLRAEPPPVLGPGRKVVLRIGTASVEAGINSCASYCGNTVGRRVRSDLSPGAVNGRSIRTWKYGHPELAPA
jgi:hypothetical protein